MRGANLFIGLVFSAFLFVPVRHGFGVTPDYATQAEAVAEMGWHDYLGYYSDSDYDFAEGDNEQCQASAYYDEIEYAGMVSFSATADTWIKPDEVVLWGTAGGTYQFDFGWPLMDYFYQEGYCTVDGWLVIDEFPVGAPCRLQIDAAFPTDTWTGYWTWQVYVESSSDYFLAGWDGDEFYDVLSGTVDAYAGEEIYVFLGNAGWGYADHDVEHLGRGSVTVTAALKAIPHVADLSADGSVTFEDFSHFSMHWQEQGCDPNTNWCGRADLDQSSEVDVNDLGMFTDYWLLLPDANNLP